jgi:hypothetical protein
MLGAMNDVRSEPCASCQGAGEIGTDHGPVDCPDCFGEGRQLDPPTRLEWRLRDIERTHPGGAHGCDADMRWLVFELRRSREALLQILSRCQDDGDGAGGGLSAELRHVANRALGLYPTRPE